MASSQEVTVHDLVDRINFHNILEGNPKFVLNSTREDIIKRMGGETTFYAPRQQGKATLLILYAISYALSNSDKHIAITTYNHSMGTLLYDHLLNYTKMVTSEWCFDGPMVVINGTSVDVGLSDESNHISSRNLPPWPCTTVCREVFWCGY